MSTSAIKVNHSGTTTFVLAALLLTFSCASSSRLTRGDVVRQYDSVAKLSDGLEDARGRDGELLAPKAFARTSRHLDDAFKHARKADKDGADKAALRGMDSLFTLNQTMLQNHEYMEEVMGLRIRAREQGAASLFEKEFRVADKKLRAACGLLEENRSDIAHERRPELMRVYAALELKGLKKGTVAKAEQAIASAADAGAEKYAPKTLQNARAELKLALSVLDADRTKREKSNAYAQEATWLANRSREITNLVRHFRSQDFTDEDRVLWYQDQLQRVQRAVRDETLPFDQDNAQVIYALREDVLSLRSVLQDTRATNSSFQVRIARLEEEIENERKRQESDMEKVLEEHRKQLAANIAAREQQLAALDSGNRKQMKEAQKSAEEQIKALKEQQSSQVRMLKERLSQETQARAEAARRERRHQARFEQVQQIFATSDAEVFRQGDNVIVRLKGFYFKPGSHEVEARNYGLLNNVLAAIHVFPDAKVKIIGHTDARGSADRNLEVSAARALSVVDFLTTVGKIAPDRVAAEGRGEEEPLATNETPEGRSQNRRIDVLIINNGQSSTLVTRQK